VTDVGERVDSARLPSADLPRLLQDHPAAVLLVDLTSQEVYYANDLARQLAPGAGLPVSIGDWALAAGLRAEDGGALQDGPTPLQELAAGAPLRGRRVTAARASDASDAREALWVMGIPLLDAPAPLDRQALVVLLPLRDADGVRGLQEAGDLRHRAVIASDLSFSISDPNELDSPLVWVNPAFERVTGYSAAEVVGLNCRLLQGPGTDRATVERIAAALRDGGPVDETVLNYRKDGTAFWNQVVISPVHDAGGRLTHHVGIQTDVTQKVEQEQRLADALEAAHSANRRLRLLAAVGETLTGRLDPEDALAALPALVVPELADWAAAVGVDERGRPSTVHLAHHDPARDGDLAAVRRGAVDWLRRSSVLRRALGGDTAVLQPHDLDAGRISAVGARPRTVAALERMGLGSAVIVPLTARGTTTGVLVLVRDGARPWGPEDLTSASDTGLRAGLALDNARLYEREHQAALTLQRSLLPELPDLDGFDVAATYRPASARMEVGGDWYDVLELPDGRIGVAIGDVTGHDLRAAAAMGQLRSVLRSYAWQGVGPADVIDSLDVLVRGLGMADIATCTYAVVDRGSGGAASFTWSSAGHPPALMRAPGEASRFLDGALTTPIGVVAPAEPTGQSSAELPPGAVVVLYTDGLVERREGDLTAGLESLRALLDELPHDATAEQVCSAVVDAMVPADGALEDDTCVLVLRRLP